MNAEKHVVSIIHKLAIVLHWNQLQKLQNVMACLQ